MEEENWQFRSFLKGYDITVENLDVIVHQLYKDVSSNINCCSCANCCKTILPSLSKQDVKRLAKELKTSNSQLIKQYLKPSEEKDNFTFKTTPCPFLAENKCTVYSARPEDCRSYPHLQKKEFVFRLIRVIENCSVCPIVFNVVELLKEKLFFDSDDFWIDYY